MFSHGGVFNASEIKSQYKIHINLLTNQIVYVIIKNNKVNEFDRRN